MKNSATNTQKLSGNLNSPIESKKSLYHYFLAILFIILLFPFSSSAQSCAFKLTTTDNTQSVNKDGRIYFIQLQNNSNEEMVMKLNVSNHNKEINPDKSDKESNVNLNVKLLNEDGTEITGSVQLKPNEVLNFQVKVTVPEGTPIKHWNNMLLKATSDKCADYSASLILYTFIPNLEER
ncbi:MAG: hypothetical protein ABR968_13935 [Bacteroidales bacterium]|jgi:hypothetical protein